MPALTSGRDLLGQRYFTDSRVEMTKKKKSRLIKQKGLVLEKREYWGDKKKMVTLLCA